ncbi:anthranilate synthase component I family protein [Cyanobium sp. NIES-981]|uniref:anthranilate synthase component I family protein n=1 Tax=Cyanobium sp. NIES-981 TaxID=1851505 RepID=UPI0007DDC1B6|nr:anthranilate synthase component I family protein [Cyanobium sp. NIES-981]SBO44197.1 Para-aminobenzoate synthase [Cyanobium sp. NIES-981]
MRASRRAWEPEPPGQPLLEAPPQPPLRRPLPWRPPEQVVEILVGALGAEGLVWLDSQGAADSPLAGQSFLAVAPAEQRCCHGLPGDPGARDPFALLAELARQARAEGDTWLGWLSYEAGAWVEPAGHWRRPDMAVLWAVRADPLVVIDRHRMRLELQGRNPATLARFSALLDAPAAGPAPTRPDRLAAPRDGWRWHTDRQQFADQVRRVQAWIVRGDLFQANLTACCEQVLPEVPGAEALVDLYLRLRRHCPAPFGGLAIGRIEGGNPLEGGSGLQAVLSTSPERFLQLKPSGQVQTRPIKGTRPRHGNPEADADAAAELITSAKDRAENVMIVDLLRNDLGRVCRPGSIGVPQLVGLESYPQVHHLTSVVEGELAAGQDVVALLKACWPGGSITGAPKVRACARLNALEPVPRGPYCGALFRLGPDGSLDSNILIRSLLVRGARLRAHAGCGIVVDSDPDDEAEEMGWKLDPLLDALA